MHRDSMVPLLCSGDNFNAEMPHWLHNLNYVLLSRRVFLFSIYLMSVAPECVQKHAGAYRHHRAPPLYLPSPGMFPRGLGAL